MFQLACTDLSMPVARRVPAVLVNQALLCTIFNFILIFGRSVILHSGFFLAFKFKMFSVNF